MASIIYVEHDGTEHQVEVPTGSSVMRGALDAGVAGIDAICGGQCACATCHCYVDAAWVCRLPAILEMEAEMLDEVTAELTDFSRLSCQLVVTPELDGLRISIPERQ
ncbi:MAG: 2Fe-2S iron-sulfur cluster-binding protein [Blastomonas sp.]